LQVLLSNKLLDLPPGGGFFMEFSIAQATINDFPTIQDLNQKLFLEEKQSGHDDCLLLDWPFSRKAVVYYQKALTDPEYLTLVARNDRRCSGYVIGSAVNKYSYRNGTTGELENIYILPDVRRNGIGRALVEHLLVWFKTKGIKRVTVSAYSRNDAAIAFYDSIGFSLASVNLETAI
jgi:ribosomal protein S18 acetylase RimI-like enzyme